eukprot:5474846-Pleurochrysis_carterae.AAC.3
MRRALRAALVTHSADARAAVRLEQDRRRRGDEGAAAPHAHEKRGTLALLRGLRSCAAPRTTRARVLVASAEQLRRKHLEIAYRVLLEQGCATALLEGCRAFSRASWIHWRHLCRFVWSECNFIGSSASPGRSRAVLEYAHTTDNLQLRASQSDRWTRPTFCMHPSFSLHCSAAGTAGNSPFESLGARTHKSSLSTSQTRLRRGPSSRNRTDARAASPGATRAWRRVLALSSVLKSSLKRRESNRQHGHCDGKSACWPLIDLRKGS